MGGGGGWTLMTIDDRGGREGGGIKNSNFVMTSYVNMIPYRYMIPYISRILTN